MRIAAAVSVPRPHADIAAQQRLIGDEAGSGELAVRAAGVANLPVGGDDALVGEAARDAEFHRQIVGPD